MKQKERHGRGGRDTLEARSSKPGPHSSAIVYFRRKYRGDHDSFDTRIRGSP
jgi:hypothetical protein